MSSLSLFLPLLCACIALCAANQNPCHDNKDAQGADVTCTKIVLPRGLCKACKLKPFLPNGNFRNCKAIYDLSDVNCRRQLRAYANLNRNCDPVRARQVNKINNENNRQGLDYFVYSVCEECCDCIPRGAKIHQYAARLATGTLLKPNRGNCPAHAWFDICKIWPKVAFVSLPGWKDPLFAPQICPLLTNWIKSPASNNWLQKNSVTIHKIISRFLTRFLAVAKCKNKKVWETCHMLESAQNRI